uniref:Uncharacterized protein n=1 Tax=Anguilla anguilla TaxID=7936 RepID=A0A0E9RBA6_ANGAN
MSQTDTQLEAQRSCLLHESLQGALLSLIHMYFREDRASNWQR